MGFFWDTLPQRLERGLLVGGVGRSHLAGLAHAALSAARTTGTPPEQAGNLARLGLELLLAAWEEDPLNGSLAEPLLALGGPVLAPAVRDALSWLGNHWKPDARIDRLAGRGEVERLLALVADRRESSGPDPYGVRACVDCVLSGGDPEQMPAVLGGLERKGWDGPAGLLLELVQADTQLILGDYTVEKELQRLADLLPLPGRRARLAHCCHRLGKPEDALRHWKNVLRVQPWNVNIAYRARDVLLGRDGELATLSGECSLLLYSYDKAHELDRTCAGLDVAGLEGCHVVVLDNGSSDATPQVIARWAAKWGAEKLDHVRMDVNIGAPAARNWLLARADVGSRPWVAFLDDDALVPKDWLGRFGAAVRAVPNANVWGCKVVDAGRPWVVQNADLHLRHDFHKDSKAEAQGGQTPTLPVTDLQHQCFDFGQFDAIRPCLSVTGCCHLFRTEHLLEQGGFDICFSPSQFDDLDRDFRVGSAGGYAVCQGFLSVEHLKCTGAAARRGGNAAGNALGNLVKLRQKHGLRALEQLADAQAERARTQIDQAMRDLADGWGE